MKKCPRCANVYPDPFQFCPVDGGELAVFEGSDADGERTVVDYRPESSISIRVLVRALLVLAALAVLSFTGVFLYIYLKPKYGGLIVKTTPAGATVLVDGRQRGLSPLTVGELRAGGHQVKVLKEGYRETVHQVEVLPYSTENLHWTMEPLVAHLSNEQLAEIESWRKKLDNATRENILLPPPDDYNALYFAGKILAIDPANAYALDTRNKIADGTRRSAEAAYGREDWLEAEKQYKNLALILPNDITVNERLTDVATKIEASLKDREKQLADWKGKAEAALKAGSLVPPDRDNALEALHTIQRLDKKSPYLREGMVRLKELLQNRGDTKISAGDWQGAQNDFKVALQYFPDDAYSKTRLQVIEAKLGELATTQQQQQQQQRQNQRLLEEQQQQQRARVTGLRQTALASYRAGNYSKAIAEWQEYLKVEPNSDEAYFYLGASNLEGKQLDTAILLFEKAVGLNPSNALAHLNLGILYDRHRNNIPLAVEHLKKAKELGGLEKYSAERLQGMINDLQSSAQVVDLQKVPFPVEHKHAFSSCRGNLRVTDGGIEYQTTETDHSFYEMYAGLRSFALSGDDLSIRTRTNKKYNFHLLNAGDGDRIKRLASRHTQITE